MTLDKRGTALANVGTLVLTILAVSLVLTVGRETPVESSPLPLAVGEPSPEPFVADRSTSPITDEAATQAARDTAGLNVDTVFTEDNSATIATQAEIANFYEDVRDGAFEEPPPAPPTPSTTEVPTTTNPIGTPEEEATSSTTSTTTTVPPTTTTTTIPRIDLVVQADLLATIWPQIRRVEIDNFVLLFNSDVDRVAESEGAEEAVFPEIERSTLELAGEELDAGIRQSDLADVQRRYLTPETQPAVFIPGLPQDERPLARSAISELVGRTLRANQIPDQAATDAAREQAAADVSPVTTIYVFGETIANEGDILSPVQVAAIDELGLYTPVVEDVPSPWAMALLGTIAVLLAAFFLWRIAPAQWSQPRHFALLGILLVLAAVISRIPELIAVDNHALGYLMPAVAIGFMAAILFDPRTAVLLSVPMAGFTAISTEDLAFTVFAAVATIVPVAFVSRVASRRRLRLAVVLTAVAVAPVAGAVEWLFGEGASDGLQAAGWAFFGALVAGFIALGLVSFFENAFGITTTLTLLDLLDRNHPALRLLEESAPGTFNHSMLVGALAGRAARAIDADPLLAQAAAWYHDLGKTQNPQYFVENQFGVSNPHDSLPSAESAAIIRSHVTDGMRLAKRYRIPADVAAGIRSHHGTSLMRYFYHKALEEDPGVDPALYRHHGVKPKPREMAIVMISDSVEAAARAYAQTEDPTAEGLMKVVDSVVGEKLDDGQLDDSDLTFGDLTRVKEEMVRALIGYYHTRVPYPGFPGPKVLTASSRAQLPTATDAATASADEDAEEADIIDIDDEDIEEVAANTAERDMPRGDEGTDEASE